MQATDIFRKNLGAVMLARAIKQTELADTIEASRAFLNRILQGKADPSLEFAGKLAAALDLQLWEMLLPPLTFSKKFLRDRADVA